MIIFLVSRFTRASSGGVRLMESGRRRLRSCFANTGPGGLGSPSAPTTRGCPKLRAGRGADENGESRWIRGAKLLSVSRKHGPEAQNRRGGAPKGGRACDQARAAACVKARQMLRHGAFRRSAPSVFAED